MKIFIINPDFGVTPEQMAARCHLLSVHVGPDVELHMECLVENHIEIDSALDAALAAPETPESGKPESAAAPAENPPAEAAAEEENEKEANSDESNL